jgi:hypothetical protein
MFLFTECSKLMARGAQVDPHAYSQHAGLGNGLPRFYSDAGLPRGSQCHSACGKRGGPDASHAAQPHQAYLENRDEVRRILDDISVKLPTYENLEWRADVQV